MRKTKLSSDCVVDMMHYLEPQGIDARRKLCKVWATAGAILKTDVKPPYLKLAKANFLCLQGANGRPFYLAKLMRTLSNDAKEEKDFRKVVSYASYSFVDAFAFFANAVQYGTLQGFLTVKGVNVSQMWEIYDTVGHESTDTNSFKGALELEDIRFPSEVDQRNFESFLADRRPERLRLLGDWTILSEDLCSDVISSIALHDMNGPPDGYFSFEAERLRPQHLSNAVRAVLTDGPDALSYWRTWDIEHNYYHTLYSFCELRNEDGGLQSVRAERNRDVNRSLQRQQFVAQYNASVKAMEESIRAEQKRLCDADAKKLAKDKESGVVTQRRNPPRPARYNLPAVYIPERPCKKFIASAVVDRHPVSGQYLVAWKDYATVDWTYEPRPNLASCIRLLEAFEEVARPFNRLDAAYAEGHRPIGGFAPATGQPSVSEQRGDGSAEDDGAPPAKRARKCGN